MNREKIEKLKPLNLEQHVIETIEKHVGRIINAHPDDKNAPLAAMWECLQHYRFSLSPTILALGDDVNQRVRAELNEALREYKISDVNGIDIMATCIQRALALLAGRDG